jgi:hypothetical protein
LVADKYFLYCNNVPLSPSVSKSIQSFDSDPSFIPIAASIRTTGAGVEGKEVEEGKPNRTFDWLLPGLRILLTQTSFFIQFTRLSLSSKLRTQ